MKSVAHAPGQPTALPGGLRDVVFNRGILSSPGTDWLAFAPLALAVLFAGVIRDPVRNIWVLQFVLIACVGIFPLASSLDPLVGDNWFSVKFEIDTTDKRSGKRSILSEIGVYKVEDGKIVKEQYFMW